MHWKLMICGLAVCALTACGGGDKPGTNSTSTPGSGTSTATGSNTSSGSGSGSEPALATAYTTSLSAYPADEAQVKAAEDTHLPALTTNSAAPAQIMAVPAGAPADPPVSAAAVITAANVATALSGSRGVFADFHDNVAPLLPESSLVTAQSSRARALQVAPDNLEQINKQIEDDQNKNNPPPQPPPGCPPVVVECVTEEVEASAEAVAVAFAWASAKACAWAQAMACVYSNIAPFGRVCAWAKSKACVSAFTTAFAFGYGFDKDKKIITVCSNGFKDVKVMDAIADAMARR
jgi:hypothetical protein